MGAQLGQIFRIQPKIVARAAAFFFHQAGRFEHLQMLRHRGPAYGQAAGELSDGRRIAPQQGDHGLAGRIGERAQHVPSVTHALR